MAGAVVSTLENALQKVVSLPSEKGTIEGLNVRNSESLAKQAKWVSTTQYKPEVLTKIESEVALVDQIKLADFGFTQSKIESPAQAVLSPFIFSRAEA